MEHYTLKQAYLNHTRGSWMSVKDLLFSNTRPGVEIPFHQRHYNPREYAAGHEQVQIRMKLLKMEPTMRNYNNLVAALEGRVANYRVARRIAARTALSIKDSPLVLAYSLRNNEHVVGLKQDTMWYKGRLVFKGDLDYDIILGDWVNTREGRWSTIRVIVKDRIQDSAGNIIEPWDVNSDSYIYAGFFLRGTQIPENDITIEGVRYTRVVDDGGNANFIHPSLTDTISVMARYDATYVLEVIDSLMSRGSTRFLRGQPDRDPSLPSIGVELELDRITDNSKYVRTITDDLRSNLGWRGSVVAVNDGSLGNNGAEFVTGWGDPELVAASIENVIAKNNLRLPKHMTNNCGVHIHLSRTFFQGVEHIAAVQWVFERAMFRPVVEFVAHRYNNQYCQANKNIRRYTNPHRGKYNAVNCDHSPSIEFRMFGAPETEGDMFHYKDLVLSVVEWARGMPRLWTPRAFGRWLADKEQYVRLFRHLEPVFLKLEPTVEEVGEEITEAVAPQPAVRVDTVSVPQPAVHVEAVPVPQRFPQPHRPAWGMGMANVTPDNLFADGELDGLSYAAMQLFTGRVQPMPTNPSFAATVNGGPHNQAILDALGARIVDRTEAVVSDPVFANDEN